MLKMPPQGRHEKGENNYTIVRKGQSKKTISFYPRNDKLETDYIELVRNPDKMEFTKV